MKGVKLVKKLFLGFFKAWKIPHSPDRTAHIIKAYMDRDKNKNVLLARGFRNNPDGPEI